MHPLQLFSVVALVVSLSPARPALIQRSTTDLLGAAAKLKVAYDDLEKYRQALEYATGVADDLKNKQEPRRPKAFEFKRADDRLDKIRRELRGLNVPPLVDPKSPEYRTDELKKNDAIAWKKAAAKLVAYNRALREH